MSNVNLLNYNVGIQQILESPDQSHIPDAKPLASNVVSEAALAEHFKIDNLKNSMEQILAPEVGDGEVLRPDVFNQNIKSSITKLSANSDPEVQTLVNDILKPMAENKELLNAYVGLMIGG